eukprot:TRINITY_DN2461_c0_g1_i1.p1 TRINITY_DN2461_c0_g1~~TRINITY_DN2461_c0_g1_i1.p1  ORF type:complete len:369 (+),score=106.10 TRINITY_DN2461_c0_g1_i1:1050-2156(+)
MSKVFGLTNVGNTCFLNSVFVSLSSIKPFITAVDHLCSKLNLIDWSKYNDAAKTNVKIIRNLNQVIQGEVAVPRRFIKHFFDLHPDLAGFHQQDAHEAFNFIVDLVHESIQGINQFLRDNPELLLKTGSDDDVYEQIWQVNSLADLLKPPPKSSLKAPEDILPFSGLYADFLTFPCGHQPEVKHVPYTSISLSLPVERPCSLNECLQAFTVRESVTGVMCDVCKEKRSVTKQLMFAKPPTILCFHFIRLLGDFKITSFVKFPFKFDLAPFMASEASYAKLLKKDDFAVISALQMMTRLPPVSYKLRSVICHHGSAYGGHYTSFRSQGDGDQWFHVSDEDVSQTDIGTVMRSEAYMLFYERDQTLRTSL